TQRKERSKMVTVTWVPPMQFMESAARGSPVMMDAAQGERRTGTGPTPMENLLLALAGCTGMDVVSILRKMRMPLEELRIDVSGRSEERRVGKECRSRCARTGWEK